MTKEWNAYRVRSARGMHRLKRSAFPRNQGQDWRMSKEEPNLVSGTSLHPWRDPEHRFCRR
jgi:hypothetical protein